jgi:hypothetical protein
VQAGGASATAARGTPATVKVSAVSADMLATNHFTGIASSFPSFAVFSQNGRSGFRMSSLQMHEVGAGRLVNR